jgi:hypothetical protein
MLHLEAQDCTPHPLPLGSGDGGLVDFWADEVGKLLASQLEASGDRFFVGVACDTAFAGQGLGSYENPRHVPTLPLVGPEELAALDPGYEWRIPGDITRQLVSFGEAKKNIHLLGGRVQDAKGTSHYQVKFRGHRTWTMSRNVDPVPDDFLRQLVEIAEYPFPVIKWVLLTGKPVPEPQLRLAGCMCRNDESCTQV